MNNIERSLGELKSMEALSAGDSAMHRLSPLAKLLVTIAYIMTVVSFHKYDLSSMFIMLLFPVLGFQAAGIPVRTCFYKLRMVLPLVLAVGLFNPFFDRATYLTLGGVRISGGVISMLTLMGKGVLCLMASFLLIATTRIDALCRSLRTLHIPSMLVTLLLLTFRYVTLMVEEVAVMSQAYALRAPGQKGIHYKAWGSFLGQLLLRSMDRAQELYASMRLRGFTGEFTYADEKAFSPKDAAFLVICIGLFLLVRNVNVTRLLGEAAMRAARG